MEFVDYYAILGVPKEAAREDIQRAYRKLARRYHPDVSKVKDAEEKFKQLNEAYEVLNDPEKRAKYDRYGAAWKAAERGEAPPPGTEDVWSRVQGGDFADFSFGGGDFSAFFEQLFGLGGGGPGARPRRGRRGGTAWAAPGADQEARLSLTLEEAAQGGTRQFSLRDPRTGRSRTFRVNVPKGIASGQRIRLAGQGEQGAGGAPAGHLYLLVDILPHPEFRLEGCDLHTVLPVTPWVAALGGEALLVTLAGTVKVKVPPGSSSGRKIRLQGLGYPSGRGAAGDLYAEIRIVVPERLSPVERELFQKLAAASSFKPPGPHEKAPE